MQRKNLILMKHIRIISPSGHIDSEWIDRAQSRLQDWGYEVSVAEHAKGQFGRFAGTEEERLADINRAFADPSVDIVLCARGGYGLQQIIDRVEIGSRCPLLVGFSDITCLHSRLALANQSSVHGLMCRHIADDAAPEVVPYYLQALRSEPLHYSLPAHSLNRLGEAEGYLIGGNLSVLYGLQGTPWSLLEICRHNHSLGRNNILFIEDIAERHYHIDRMMHNLRLSGLFSYLSGMVVGQFSDCDNDPSIMQSDGRPMSVYDTILAATRGYSFPILFDFPAGHVTPNFPLRMNAPVRLQLTASSAQLHNSLPL